MFEALKYRPPIRLHLLIVAPLQFSNKPPAKDEWIAPSKHRRHVHSLFYSSRVANSGEGGHFFSSFTEKFYPFASVVWQTKKTA